MTPNRKARRIDWLSAALAFTAALGTSNCNHPGPLTPVQEEAEVITDLEKSGPVPDALKKDLEPKAKELWSTTFALGLKNLRRGDRDVSTGVVKVGSVGCFKAGCMVKLWFKDRDTVRAFEEGLLVGPESPLRIWPGRIYRGPLIEDRTQGGVLSLRGTWALMINRPRYKELAELSTVRHASVAPDQPVPTNEAISNLQRGEP